MTVWLAMHAALRGWLFISCLCSLLCSAKVAVKTIEVVASFQALTKFAKSPRPSLGLISSSSYRSGDSNPRGMAQDLANRVTRITGSDIPSHYAIFCTLPRRLVGHCDSSLSKVERSSAGIHVVGTNTMAVSTSLLRRSGLEDSITKYFQHRIVAGQNILVVHRIAK